VVESLSPFSRCNSAILRCSQSHQLVIPFRLSAGTPLLRMIFLPFHTLFPSFPWRCRPHCLTRYFMSMCCLSNCAVRLFRSASALIFSQSSIRSIPILFLLCILLPFAHFRVSLTVSQIVKDCQVPFLFVFILILCLLFLLSLVSVFRSLSGLFLFCTCFAISLLSFSVFSFFLPASPPIFMHLGVHVLCTAPCLGPFLSFLFPACTSFLSFPKSRLICICIAQSFLCLPSP